MPLLISGSVLGLGGALLRWGRKVDKSMTLNVESMSHVADTLTDLDRRLTRVEEAIALRPRGSYDLDLNRPIPNEGAKR